MANSRLEFFGARMLDVEVAAFLVKLVNAIPTVKRQLHVFKKLPQHAHRCHRFKLAFSVRDPAPGWQDVLYYFYI